MTTNGSEQIAALASVAAAGVGPVPAIPCGAAYTSGHVLPLLLLETRASPLILLPPSDPGAQAESRRESRDLGAAARDARAFLSTAATVRHTAHSKSEDSLLFTSGYFITAAACTDSAIFILIANI